MTPGSFSFHTNIPVYVAGEQGEAVNIPVDVAIMPLSAHACVVRSKVSRRFYKRK